ncbi:MAG: hypothetical protein ACOC8F_05410 [Planctomycetota bacterium]
MVSGEASAALGLSGTFGVFALVLVPLARDLLAAFFVDFPPFFAFLRLDEVDLVERLVALRADVFFPAEVFAEPFRDFAAFLVDFLAFREASDVDFFFATSCPFV